MLDAKTNALSPQVGSTLALSSRNLPGISTLVASSLSENSTQIASSTTFTGSFGSENSHGWDSFRNSLGEILWDQQSIGAKKLTGLNFEVESIAESTNGTGFTVRVHGRSGTIAQETFDSDTVSRGDFGPAAARFAQEIAEALNAGGTPYPPQLPR